MSLLHEESEKLMEHNSEPRNKLTIQRLLFMKTLHLELLFQYSEKYRLLDKCDQNNFLAIWK